MDESALGKTIDEILRIEGSIFVEDGFIIFDVDHEYRIALDRCNTPNKILGWVLHLCEKQWIEPALINQFISIAARHNRINITDA